MGRGEKNRFWKDKWLGIEKLRVLFPRVFQISSTKSMAVAEAGAWTDDRWSWFLSWRRQPRGREISQVSEMFSLPNQCSPNGGSQWQSQAMAYKGVRPTLAPEKKFFFF